MAKKKGNISRETGMKPKIIEFILNNKGPIEEAGMRKKLQGDSGNINRHLHELWEEFKCIELIQTIKKGCRNYNLWDITKIKHLKNINEKFYNIQLNRYEKSINIVTRNLGYDINSPGYIYCFIRLYRSRSFFNKSLNTDVKSLTAEILKIYRFGVGFEGEIGIEELTYEYNAKYIKGEFNLEIPDQKFREVMEKLALRKEEILEEYAWRVCHCRTEQAKENLRNTSNGNDLINAIKSNTLQNPESYPLEPVPWVESFWMEFQKIVPELSEISVETILKTPDEYKDMCTEMSKLLFLIEKQQEMFNEMYFNLLFESFYTEDVLNEIDLPEEWDFAKKTKKYRKEYENTVKKKDYRIIEDALHRMIFNEHKIVSEFMAEHKMPSILSKISDDPKEVLRELLKLNGYHDLLKYLESGSVEEIISKP